MTLNSNSTFIPWDPKADTRDRRHQQLVAMLLNSLIRQGLLTQQGLDWTISGTGSASATASGSGTQPQLVDRQLWYSDSSDPPARLGKEGDFYLQSTGQVWQKLAPYFGVPPAWRLQAMAIRGPRGTQGERGPAGVGLTGPAGPTGATGAAGAMTLISAQTLGGATATITFSSISGSFTHLQLIATGRISAALVSDNVMLRFNSDSGSNYQYEQFQASATSPICGAAVAQAQGLLGNFAGASATAGLAGYFSAIIPGYAGTTFNKIWQSQIFLSIGTGSTVQIIQNDSGQWLSTAAVNRIDLTVSGGSNFVTGSVFSLYGIL